MSTTVVPSSAFSPAVSVARLGLASASVAPDLAALLPLHGPVLLASNAWGATDAPIVIAHLAAERLGVPLAVVTVLEPVPVYAYGTTIPALPPAYEERRRVELETLVQQRLRAALPDVTPWALHLRYGSPAAGIAEVAATIGASLVVVGAGAHGMVDRVLGDEVAVQLAAHTPCPVLAVSAECDTLPTRAIVGVDFSPASVRAARVALALIGGGSATLTLVHARPAIASDLSVGLTWDGEYDAGVAELFTRVRDLLRPVTPSGVTVETWNRVGHTAAVLTNAAAGTDLVAVGSRGASWAERLMLGSVATGVLRHARTAVMVAPAPRPAAALRIELAVQGHIGAQTPAAYPDVIAAFAARNTGRRTQLTVYDARDDSVRVQVDGYVLAGAVYDPHDCCATLMLHDPRAPQTHLTHAVLHVTSMLVSASDARYDRALVIEHEGGQAVVTFRDP